MNNHIKTAILNGRLVLLLGAGASYGCVSGSGKQVPLGRELAEILASSMGEEYAGEDLSDVYSAAKNILGSQINDVFESNFKHCKPSAEYLELVKYPFFRIYSLNIDDALEAALYRNSSRKVNVRQRYDRVTEVDQLYQTLDYIKLNGDVSYPTGGYIFSPQEYGGASAKEPLWYEELARDYFKYTFLFIGTQLKEPLFYHQVEKYKIKTEGTELRSYVLVPSLSSIVVKGLETNNICHVAGTLSDFTAWLAREFPVPPTAQEILFNKRPELQLNSTDSVSYVSLLAGVVPVNRASLSLLPNAEKIVGVRDFYKGFKPTWNDIIDGVPAYLGHTRRVYEGNFHQKKPAALSLFLLLGQAGCGKTTALKQIALKIADGSSQNVYYIDERKDNLLELIKELDSRNSSEYYLFIERVGDMAPQIGDVILGSKSNKAIFVCAENPSIWMSRVKEYLADCVTSEIDISNFSDSDADLILAKIEEYGNWTRLGKMSPKNRKIEILKKSKKQLLIGLMEATSGDGYNEIIKKDFAAIDSEEQQALLILSGLAATQGVPASEATLTRALSNLGYRGDVLGLCNQMAGTLKYNNGNVTTRHRVYIDRLFNLYVSSDRLRDAVVAYIKAFAVYQFPIVTKVSRNEGAVYKKLVNAKSLKKLLKNDENRVLSVYAEFEKLLEHEGLFLLQYGLSLRSFNRNDEAFEKIRVANQAFPESPHIEHALAQQRIILACREDDEVIAMAHFNEAENILRRLDSSDIRIFDKYPIITLSEGHVKVVDRFQGKSAAKVVARMYHDQISRDRMLVRSPRVAHTVANLMKFCVSGVWPEQQFEDFDYAH
ncbi:SIR2 family protein [Pseudomonas juntendi]|uniref:P-loop NTPase n=2 Tax=Pseudomonas juntendi TaxID=2666183 RepID=UPI0018D5C0C9|nr:SIR2 family protein [Pseudomonas juntendi]MBH3372556.1 SIR2 family protein [Pseudomonas juntendi]